MSRPLIRFIILILFLPFSVGAQQQLPCFAPTPTAVGITRFGDVPMSPFTGLPSISIPIYSFNIVGLELPLKLDYDASGVQMNVLPGWVGQNWSLSAGGVITRAVNNVPDEFLCPSHDPGKNKFSNYFQSYSVLQDALYSSNPQSNLYDLLNGSLTYDLEPDVFTFSFLGYHGQFFLGNDGQWKVMCEDNLDVEFDVNNFQNHLLKPFIEKYPSTTATGGQPGTIEGFRILDGNGFIYEFGFNTDAIEYVTDFMRQSQAEKYSSWIATSWYLRNIKDRYGNILYSFTYERGEFVAQFYHAYQSTITDGSGSWTSNSFLGTGGGFSFSGLQATNAQFPLSAHLNAPVYLRRIDAADKTYAEFFTETTDQSSLQNSLAEIIGEPVYGKLRCLASGQMVPQGNIFEYLENPKYSAYRVHELSYASYNNLFVATGTRRLWRIKIGNLLSKECNTISFTYEQMPRLHLTKIFFQEPSDETGTADKHYELIYDRYETLPSNYLTRNADHWGYYRPQPFPSNYNNQQQIFANFRQPNEDYMKRGVLKGIIYPTGGLTTFEYEANTFSSVQSLDRSHMSDSAGIGGGLRVKCIRNYEDSTASKILGFKSYAYNIPNTNVSSGELIAAPMYYWHKWQANTLASNICLYISSFRNTSIVPLVNSFGPSVGYTWVEETNADGSRRIYHYSNLSNTPHDQLQTTFGFNSNVPSPYDKYSELGFMRGKLLNESEYSDSNDLIRSTNYLYRSDMDLSQSVLCSNLSIDTSPQNIGYYEGRIYYRFNTKYDLAGMTSTTHQNTSSTINETYHRSDHHMARSVPYFHYTDIRTLDSVSQIRGNSCIKKSFRYTINSDEQSAHSLFDNAFDLRIMGETTYHNQNLVSQEITELGNFSILQQTWALPKYFINVYPSGIRDTIVTFHSYNSKGQPYVYKLIGEEYTALSWIINDCLLGSKYIGKTPAGTGLSESCHIGTEWISKLGKIFISSIDDGLLYIYTYDPLKGVVSITSPNGITTYYDYGRMGVLKLIRDENGNTIKEFKMNYRLK